MVTAVGNSPAIFSTYYNEVIGKHVLRANPTSASDAGMYTGVNFRACLTASGMASCNTMPNAITVTVKYIPVEQVPISKVSWAGRT